MRNTDFEPSVRWCRGDNFTTEHWIDLFRLIQIPRGTAVDQLKFGDLLARVDALAEHLDAIKSINERAHVEISIRESLREIELWAGSTEFLTTEAADSLGKKVFLVRDWTDYLAELGDQQRLVSTLKESAYYNSFSDAIDIWENKLSVTGEVLVMFCEIQRRWLYLEPVFCRGVFPSEKAAFLATHNAIIALLGQAHAKRAIVAFSVQKGLVDQLNRLLQKLQSSQKALSTYLEDKRNSFSRFFFLGDDDLLEILGRPLSVQTHLRKLFAGIAALRITDTDDRVLAAKSLSGEVVQFPNSIQIEETPEQWLNELSDSVKERLKNFVMSGKKTSFEETPGQILCLQQQIDFASKVEQALRKGKALKDLKSEISGEIKQFANGKTPDMEPVTQEKLTAMILDAVHHRDVVEQLIAEGCEKQSDWPWLRQLRFYKSGARVEGRMIDSVEDYSWEYQGIPSRLVHTPLTDKCFVSLTQALHLGLGGNPYGPAGTGKTESVKELGCLLGRHVLVFNCDEGLDVMSMSRIFMGLCRGGAWGCFDEFNRLSEIVLSAVSMDIQTIQTALMKKASHVTLQEVDSTLSHHTAIFVTLNPAGKGYGGRRKLPDNLKALFRPVAMSKPDNAIISKVMLFAEGFQNEEIGRRIVHLFVLCKELLSEQQHYDWGLRALKTVLATAGKLLREMNMTGRVRNPWFA